MLVEAAASLARLVKIVLAKTNNILDSFLNDSVIDAVFGPQNESEHVFEYWLGLSEEVFESEEEYRCLILLYFSEPKVVPLDPHLEVTIEESFPKGTNVFGYQRLPD